MFFTVTITNTGAPSAAGGWHLHFKSPSVGEKRIDFMRIGEVHKDGVVVMRDSDSIYEKALRPVERGGICSGWVRFVAPGKQARDDMEAGKAEMLLHFYDILGVRCEIAYKASGGAGQPEVYIPGIKNLNLASKRTEFMP